MLSMMANLLYHKVRYSMQVYSLHFFLSDLNRIMIGHCSYPALLFWGDQVDPQGELQVFPVAAMYLLLQVSLIPNGLA